MIDAEICFKSLLFVTESLEKLMGANGAKAVLRTAGQRAANSLIEMLPQNLTEEESVQRIEPILVKLGFIGGMKLVSPDTLQITENHVAESLVTLGLQDIQSAKYYLIGLFEGFFKQLSGSTRKVVSAETGASGEIWKLG
jgi:hypothetical protein